MTGPTVPSDEELRAAARTVEHSAGIKHQAKAVADLCRRAAALDGTP